MNRDRESKLRPELRRNSRNVLILARPLSISRWFGPLADTSDGKMPLCHWAVLVADPDVTISDVKALAMRERRNTTINDELSLGALFELKRDDKSSTMNWSPSFGTKELMHEWRLFSCEHVGNTNMSLDKIYDHGIPLVQCRR